MSLPYKTLAGVAAALSIASGASAADNSVSDVAAAVKDKSVQIERLVAERATTDGETSLDAWQRKSGGEPLAVAMTRPGVSFNSVAARHVQWATTVSIKIDEACDFAPLNATVADVESCIAALNSISGFHNTGLTADEQAALREFGSEMMAELG